jgi:effector-binding domain-containing protein
VTPELVDVDPSTLIAAVGTALDHTQIPALIPQLLDQVWAHIRGHDIEHGHNVIVYRNHGQELTGGVQVPGDTAEPRAPLILTSTPAGRAAHLRHVGPYSQIPKSTQQLFGWCGEHGHAVAEPSWEVYGDWEEDESKLVTDLYVLVQE